ARTHRHGAVVGELRHRRGVHLLALPRDSSRLLPRLCRATRGSVQDQRDLRPVPSGLDRLTAGRGSSMRIFELGSGPDRFEGGAGVVAIGNFDGVHLGHRQVVRRVIERARTDGVPASVLTFEPYPREYFTPDAAPPRLTSCRHKFELLLDAGVDRVYCARFGRALAATTAED